MKLQKLFCLTIIIFVSIQSYTQEFYDIESINTIEISFVESNWDAILDQYALAGDEERLMGSVSLNGQIFDSVGVRYKGNSSYNPNQIKNPLNIKLDYIINDQNIDGYGTIKLANVYKDPTFVREVMAYEIARNYFPASLSNYANVYVNGTYLGFYTSDQSVDKFFAQNHYGSNENAYFKGEINNDKNPTGGVWEYLESDSSAYEAYYTKESDYGWSDLINFTDILNNHSDLVEEVLDIDRHLWFLAFSNLTVNLDGPINNPQNYYIYKDNNGQFNPAPWDLNECFGVFSTHQTLGPLSPTQLQHLSPYANENEADFPIISKILNNETYRKIYVAHMKTIIEEHFAEGQYESRALELQDLIAADVQADPNKFFTYNQFESNVYNQIGGGPQSIIGIVQLMDERVNYLMSLSDFQNEAPEISNVNHSIENPNSGTEVWITAEVNNSEEVQLSFRFNSFGIFEKKFMYDDGAHEDGIAGDGIYGASIIATANIEYYIYAGNSDAVAFNPVRAEYEFYDISVNSNLVINEFMANNENTIADQDGEYDDWIEFYNNGNEDINLHGYFLSDDPNELDKWIFPDTIILAGGYLIVWADKDEEQQGLHADMKLSANGEMIILSDADLNIIDEISFGIQKTDTTTGRYPNGIGDFIEMLPTFESENNDSLTEIENETEITILDFQNYPNPFTQSTQITFNLNSESEVVLEVFNFHGQKISELVSTKLYAGKHSYKWDAVNQTKGVYICRLSVNGNSLSRKMIIQ